MDGAATEVLPESVQQRVERLKVERLSRRVTTIDGETSLQEVVGTCCRKKAPLSLPRSGQVV